MPDIAEVLARPDVIRFVEDLIFQAAKTAGVNQTHAERIALGMKSRLEAGEKVDQLVAIANSVRRHVDAVVHGVTWVVIRDGQVALERCAKKARVLGVGEWFIPGGKIEGDESELDALVREIGEEWPGVTIDNLTALPIVEGSAVPPGPRGLFLMRPFAVTVAGDVPSASSEGTEIRWFPVEDALESPVIQVRMMIAAALSAAPLRAQ